MPRQLRNHQGRGIVVRASCRVMALPRHHISWSCRSGGGSVDAEHAGLRPATTERGAGAEPGGGDVDTATPVVFAVMAARDQMKSKSRRERITDSVAERRAAGKDLGGRRQTFIDSQIRSAVRPIEGGEPTTQVPRDPGKSRATLCRRTRGLPVASIRASMSPRRVGVPAHSTDSYCPGAVPDCSFSSWVGKTRRPPVAPGASSVTPSSWTWAGGEKFTLRGAQAFRWVSTKAAPASP